MVNGALRSIQRFGTAVDTPEFYVVDKEGAVADEWDGLCRYYSLPRWLGDLWHDAYGREAALCLMRRSFARPWSGVRVNARHEAAEDLLADLRRCAKEACGEPVGRWGVAFAPGGLPARVLGQSLSQWRASGALSLQSAGSQLAVQALELDRWNAPVWDACAGFGGKSAALLEQGINVTLCTDRSWSRLRHLPGVCRELRLPRPAVCLADACAPPLTSWNGHILLDAPCSGLGVLARRPDIRKDSRRSPADLKQLEALQNRMLLRLGALLQQGLELAYITCTLNPTENELAVSRLLAARPELALLRQWQTPHEHPWLEGMYGAVLRRR